MLRLIDAARADTFDDVLDEPLDDRLEMALSLLRKPARKPLPPMLPVLASVGLAGSGLLLALVMIMGIGWDTHAKINGPAKPEKVAEASDEAPASPPVSAAVASSTAAFELSGSAPNAQPTTSGAAASPPVKDAVIVGTE